MDDNSIPLLVIGAGSMTLLGELSRGDAVRPAVLIGTAGLGIALMFAGMGAPQVAHGIALVVFLTALLTSGYDVANGIVRALNR